MARQQALTLPPAAGTRFRVSARNLALSLMTAVAAAYFSTIGLLLHFNFQTFGWDLGIFDQVLWNTAHGHWFEYSFRQISYLGDHFAPGLIVLSPLTLLGLGASPLLAVQGLSFGLAVVPLFLAARKLSSDPAAWLLSAAYLISLPVLQAINYDFHVEAFVPLLAFTAFWALTCRRLFLFAAASLVLLLFQEDMFLLVLALCWLAWAAFGERKAALLTGGLTIGYAAIVLLLVMPYYLGHDINPMANRYGYLGHGILGIAAGLVVHPLRVFDHLTRGPGLQGLVLVLAGVGFLPLLKPRLWPPLVALFAVPLLSNQPPQAGLLEHYAIVPATFALIVSAVALSSPALARFRPALRRLPAGDVAVAAAAVALLAGIAVSAWKSPSPPSASAYMDRFLPGAHAAAAKSIVKMVPPGVRVSAQSNLLPHLTHRRDVYEFPRVLNAEYVLLDAGTPVPDYAQKGFAECQSLLPQMGFHMLRSQAGVSLWWRPPDTGSDFPQCDGTPPKR